MDKLENFIREHRDEFDVYEPDKDLWEKFKKQKTKSLRSMGWLWKAAVVVLVFFASFWAQQQLKNKHQPETGVAGINPEMAIPELAEADKYYSGLIQHKLTEVQVALVSYPELKKDMRHELSELDSVFQSLKNDLKDQVSNPEIIDAMIQNYRLKLNLLEQIQAELHERNTKNNKKNNGHETGKEI